ncbi:hypothetical protein SAMN05216490_4896 [Mucilaginibacter mallensis]|uniref:Uncharacterized protein n=1 Tax=Mucilaginibacter mallensis TaxID=652787 RepID=A0A1H2CD29_MUCMA|nr:hypothetical protein [Mucilaginibacter mallensis]SDT68343.1 hypothetical protein SAMN05216490_4896 [Mucilaginibacter mallensis]
MLIEFVTQPQFNFLTAFAEAPNVSVVNNELQIPSSLGEGFVRRVDLNDDFRLLIHRYRQADRTIFQAKRTILNLAPKEPVSTIFMIR